MFRDFGILGSGFVVLLCSDLGGLVLHLASAGLSERLTAPKPEAQGLGPLGVWGSGVSQRAHLSSSSMEFAPLCGLLVIRFHFENSSLFLGSCRPQK